MLKINCLFISKKLKNWYLGGATTCQLHLFSYKKQSIAVTILGSAQVTHNLYVHYTRKHSKDSVTFVLYVDTTAELNVVFIIKCSQRLLYVIKHILFHLPHSCFSWFANTFSSTI